MFTLSLTNLQHSFLIAVGLCLFMLVCHILANNHEAKEILETNGCFECAVLESDLLPNTYKTYVFKCSNAT